VVAIECAFTACSKDRFVGLSVEVDVDEECR
jgi:hypothetical protein